MRNLLMLTLIRLILPLCPVRVNNLSILEIHKGSRNVEHFPCSFGEGLVRLYLCSNIEFGIDILQNLKCFVCVWLRVCVSLQGMNIFIGFTCEEKNAGRNSWKIKVKSFPAWHESQKWYMSFIKIGIVLWIYKKTDFISWLKQQKEEETHLWDSKITTGFKSKEIRDWKVNWCSQLCNLTMNETTEGQKGGRWAEWAGKRGYEGSGKERSEDCVEKGPVREKGGMADRQTCLWWNSRFHHKSPTVCQCGSVPSHPPYQQPASNHVSASLC